jgi:hypothetical protein
LPCAFRPTSTTARPSAALDLVGQAVRAFGHRSSARFHPGRDGWRYPSDAYRALGELTYLTGALPQVCAHIAASQRAQLEQAHIGIDHGTSYADNQAAAIQAASTALASATHAAHRMYRGLVDAQTAINAASYTGPDMED